MRERDFVSEFGRSIRHEGGFWHKISDSPIFKGMKTRFTRKKPFDGIAVLPGLVLFCEMKIARPSITLMKHQEQSLRQIQRLLTCDALAAIIIYEGRGRAWLVPIAHYPRHHRTLHRRTLATLGVPILKRQGYWTLHDLRNTLSPFLGSESSKRDSENLSLRSPKNWPRRKKRNICAILPP